MHGRLIRWVLPFLLVAFAAVSVAMAATTQSTATVKTSKSKMFGSILVSSNGHTLYRYTLDSKGVNRCSGNTSCNKFWPALLVKAGAKLGAGAGVNAALLGTIKSAHGMRQVTYAGFPLYLFAGDKAAGQLKGQDFDSKWFVVNRNGALVKHATSAPTPTPTTTGSSSGGGGAWG